MLTLHGYWRSSAAYRVRIALNLKGLDYAQITHDLRTGAQSTAAYTALNPQGLVPALDDEGTLITQSLAIIEWLEERYPAPALLPKTAQGRATVRAMAGAIACDIHPLNNLRVLKTLKRDFNADQPQLDAWAQGWIEEGFAALETQIAHHGRGFCFGDTPSMADCCLVPQVFSAERFNVDLTPFPLIRAINARCIAEPAFARAHPQAQPDADPA